MGVDLGEKFQVYEITYHILCTYIPANDEMKLKPILISEKNFGSNIQTYVDTDLFSKIKATRIIDLKPHNDE